MVKASKAGSAELVIIMSYPTSPSGIIVLLKNAQKISRILPDFICKSNRFSACFSVTMFGEHGIIAVIIHSKYFRNSDWLKAHA